MRPSNGDFQKIVFRRFIVQQENVTAVNEWYEEGLSSPTWEIITIDTYSSTDFDIHNCLHAFRLIDEKQIAIPGQFPDA